jgi:hypothetical protein
MEYKVDLDLLRKSSLLGCIIPTLFTNFKNELRNNMSTKGRDDYNGDQKRKIIGLFNTVYENIAITSEKNNVMKKNRDQNELEILTDLGSAINIYKTTKKLIQKYKKFMEINNINIICSTSINKTLLSMKDELNRLKRYEIFDSINLQIKQKKVR